MQTLTGKIGILGGSFDLAHEGHVFISKQAKELLALDKVLWLPSYRHPFKPKQTDFDTRLDSAHALASPRWIEVSDFERQHKTQNSFETLSLLREHTPKARFVFLMGADVFCELSLWHRWEELVCLMPLAVHPRGDVKPRAAKTALQYDSAIVPDDKIATLPALQAPAIAFLASPKLPISSTQIRANKSKKDN